ncbi:MAG: hypothetical protein Tsb0021_13810 [Chlamydiales bacterium]
MANLPFGQFSDILLDPNKYRNFEENHNESVSKDTNGRTYQAHRKGSFQHISRIAKRCFQGLAILAKGITFPVRYVGSGLAHVFKHMIHRPKKSMPTQVNRTREVIPQELKTFEKMVGKAFDEETRESLNRLIKIKAFRNKLDEYMEQLIVIRTLMYNESEDFDRYKITKECEMLKRFERDLLNIVKLKEFSFETKMVDLLKSTQEQYLSDEEIDIDGFIEKIHEFIGDELISDEDKAVLKAFFENDKETGYQLYHSYHHILKSSIKLRKELIESIEDPSGMLAPSSNKIDIITNELYADLNDAINLLDSISAKTGKNAREVFNIYRRIIEIVKGMSLTLNTQFTTDFILAAIFRPSFIKSPDERIDIDPSLAYHTKFTKKVYFLFRKIVDALKEKLLKIEPEDFFSLSGPESRSLWIIYDAGQNIRNFSSSQALLVRNYYELNPSLPVWQGARWKKEGENRWTTTIGTAKVTNGKLDRVLEGEITYDFSRLGKLGGKRVELFSIIKQYYDSEGKRDLNSYDLSFIAEEHREWFIEYVQQKFTETEKMARAQFIMIGDRKRDIQGPHIEDRTKVFQQLVDSAGEDIYDLEKPLEMAMKDSQ